MIGAHQIDKHTMEENKKRNADLAELDRSPAKKVIVSPPSKKLKQCRLPFQLLAQSPTNRNPVKQTDQESNKRKRVVSGSGLESPPLCKKIPENKPKINQVKKIKTINKSMSDAEVSSSSEGAGITTCHPVLVSEADSSCNTPKRVVLDQFFHKTQQPEVSTSDGEDVNERSLNTHDRQLSDKEIKQIELKVIDLCFEEIRVDKKETDSVHESPDTSEKKIPESDNITSDDCVIVTDAKKSSKENDNARENDGFIIITDTPKRCKRSSISSKQGDDGNAMTNMSSSNKVGEENMVTTPVQAISSATPVRILSTPVLADKTPDLKDKTTPVTKGKTPNKTPKSAKALQKEAERKRKQEEKEKLMKEKKQKQEEEKAEKQRLKEEAKATKEKERLEAKRLKDLEKEKKEKEKQEKKQKEEEAKQEIMKKKEEEKKKKQELLEAKLEEKRKREEEKRKQEEEEQRINNEKRLKQEKQEKAFRNFFTKAPEPAIVKEQSSPDLACGPFAAFELKDGMTLAPKVRRVLDEQMKQDLTKYISNQSSTASYLEDMKCTGFKAGKCLKTLCDSNTKVLPEGMQLVRCKFLQFHENYRPAFYGTMRKKSRTISPRNPFAMDQILDYEVDSDDEWEEPGESLSHSEGEDDPASGDEDEDDDGFFVPHGYLSEDEGGNDCEDGIKKMKEKQAAKAQAWEAGLKKKIETLTPVLIGPMWVCDNNNDQSKQLKILQQYAAIVLVNTPIPTSFNQLSSTDSTQNATECGDSGKNNVIKKSVPKEAMPDLIRLVHGNTAGIKSLSRTFREYWDRKERNATDDDIMDSSPLNTPTCIRGPSPINDDENTSRPTTPSDANFSISVRQMKLKINKIAVRERRNGYDRDCWYVHEEILKKYNLLDLPVPNPKIKEKKGKANDTSSPVSAPRVSQIAQFTKKLSPEAYQKQTQQNLAVLKEKQDQEKLKKEQERALQLKLQQERIEKYRQEQEKIARIRLEQAKAIQLKMQHDAKLKAAQHAASNHFIQPKLVETPTILNPLPTMYNTTLQSNQPVQPKPCPPKKSVTVMELLAKKKVLNILKSTVVNTSTDSDIFPQNMEVDCGYSADCEGQGI